MVDVVVPAENPADAVYGLLAVGALLAAESGRHESFLDTELSAFVAAWLYWLLHAYSSLLGGRLARSEPLTPGALLHALRRHSALLSGAAVPIGLVAVGWALGAAQETAVTIALWGTIACLVLFELLAGVRSRAAPRELVLQVTVGAAMGLAILALKAILH
jgi:hypothetical protein